MSRRRSKEDWGTTLDHTHDANLLLKTAAVLSGRGKPFYS
jgi:hypothetical protein